MTDQFKKLIASRPLRITLGILLALLLASFIFEGGVFVGYHRAAFRYEWNRNYFRGVNDPHSVWAPFSRGSELPMAHGALGQIVSVELPEVMIKGRQTPEQIIMIGPTTQIRRFHETATTTDLAPGQQVIIIGSPDTEGRIEASFVRILPSPATTTTKY